MQGCTDWTTENKRVGWDAMESGIPEEATSTTCVVSTTERASAWLMMGDEGLRGFAGGGAKIEAKGAWWLLQA